MKNLNAPIHLRTEAVGTLARYVSIPNGFVNVVACRFYRRMGCKSARAGGYMHLPEEMKLLWSLTL